MEPDITPTPKRRKLTKGVLYDVLASMTPEERKERKGDEFAKLPRILRRQHPKFPNIEVSVSKPVKIPSGFEVTIQIWRDGVELDLSLENPFRFINPPILVPSGTRSLETTADGKEAMVDDMEESLPKALRRVVEDAVELVIKNK